MAMKFKQVFLLFAFLIAMLPYSAYAQKAKKDSVVVEDISFKNLQKTEIRGLGGNVLRMEVDVTAKDSGDLKSKWLRNVEVEVMLGYEDEKAGTKGGYVFLKSRAKLFAVQIAKKTPVVFYIPWEAYQVYRITGEPTVYQVSLFVNGSEIKLSRENLKSRVSKTIKSEKDLNEFAEKIADAQSLNEGVLRPLNECPSNIQMHEYEKAVSSNVVVPTYLIVK